MDRRRFLQSSAVGVVAATAVGPAGAEAKTAPKKVLMKLGTQQGHSEDLLTLFSAFGVNHICTGEISSHLDEKWSVEDLSKLRERVESHGIKLECVPIPLPSSYISHAEMLGA